MCARCVLLPQQAETKKCSCCRFLLACHRVGSAPALSHHPLPIPSPPRIALPLLPSLPPELAYLQDNQQQWPLHVELTQWRSVATETDTPLAVPPAQSQSQSQQQSGTERKSWALLCRSAPETNQVLKLARRYNIRQQLS